jgi:hypothetical protein
MGMDVFGMFPRSKTGQYFRANVWYWHPLAEYIETHHGDIANRCEDWHSNGGAGLGDEDAASLASRLRNDLSDGTVAKYAEQRQEYIGGLDPEACEFCQTTGVRKDEVGIKKGYHDKQLTPEQTVRFGREFGWCNACDGAGYQRPWAAWYHFDAETVAEFADFLADCGGFEIR